ncbi:hypothetical protein [Pedobacter sp. SYSU D00535]|uniref:hypothetical protein n=1 Tax=Pedobacter sp. SYSU D00535 TaxID=2810308 RepID=UPI001A96C6C5|nr:hypothetical protein [Pedobacter sp. SYSU D00535]
MDSKKNNFVVVTYSHLPNTEYLCDYEGAIRVKVSKLREQVAAHLSTSQIYALADNCVYLFEDIGSSICSAAELMPAIQWYKKYSNADRMKVFLPGQKP